MLSLLREREEGEGGGQRKGERGKEGRGEGERGREGEREKGGRRERERELGGVNANEVRRWHIGLLIQGGLGNRIGRSPLPHYLLEERERGGGGGGAWRGRE